MNFKFLFNSLIKSFVDMNDVMYFQFYIYNVLVNGVWDDFVVEFIVQF